VLGALADLAAAGRRPPPHPGSVPDLGLQSQLTSTAGGFQWVLSGR